MLIGAQAFQETPKSHAPAIVLALTPHLAAWGKLQIDNALGAAGTNAMAVGLDKLGQVGVLYDGLAVLGGGAILGGLVLGAIAVFIIDRKFVEGRRLRAGRRGAHLLRLHARREDRHRPVADGGGELSRRRRRYCSRARATPRSRRRCRRRRNPCRTARWRGRRRRTGAAKLTGSVYRYAGTTDSARGASRAAIVAVTRRAVLPSRSRSGLYSVISRPASAGPRP